MSNKKLSVLGILASASIVLAVFVSQCVNKSKQVSATAGYLIQGLDPASIAKIIISTDSNTITLDRQQNGFVVENRSNYPASTKTINALITSCLDIKMVEFYTEDKANYEDLGVTEESGQAVVKFLDANGNVITGLIIGKDCPSGGLYYGRLVNDNKVYVMDNVPWPGASPNEYITKELITLNKAEIASVTVKSPSESYTLAPEANSAEVALKELPAGKIQKNSECEAVFSALTNLSFEDVNTVSDKPDLKFDREYGCLLKNSTLFLIEIAQKDSKTYIKCSADFTDKTQVRKEEGVESQEELKKKEAKLLAREKVKKFQDATSGWVYEIPSYYADKMTKPMKELVEDAPEPNDANEPQEK
ncbi:MAG: DUF4340 domain-containing protein [Phycisphaerae bacterium]|jgi:hypothetical protein